ncbi:MAG: hypothetical protein RLZZ618_881 [Pseudomonadota bacterium]|jgi:tripartite-type tricarboxylate transporter receptor subunit TctC
MKAWWLALALPLSMSAGVVLAANDKPPLRPLTIVVPFPAGGPTDKVARQLAEALRRQLAPQHVLIDHEAGAGGTVGATKVARAPKDGHTLLLTHISMATAPALYPRLPYKPLEDFEFLGLVNEAPMVLVGRASLPATSPAELTGWLQAAPRKANLAHAGVGSASHLCGLLLQSRLKIRLNEVPFKGADPAMSELLAGHVDVLCDQVTHAAPQIAAGRIKGFAAAQPATGSRDEPEPFGVIIWHGLYAPKGTPAPWVDRFHAALKRALADPDFIRQQAALGATVVNDERTGSAGHRAFVAKETLRWAAVIRAQGRPAD